jgi:23S rRNA (cytidine1920-2'-O)/16S rRNA (cytidine1409-2'-O)-methyltransferase
MARTRADLLLVARGLFESRAKARAAIEAGGVSADGRLVVRVAELIEETAEVIATAAHPWVGRGGLKLDHALTLWPIAVGGRTVLDVGASTGGFTQVCLQRGAARVYAIDVGRGQLHAELRGDSRVVDLEATDARALDRTLIPETIGLIVCDVSFIGLAKALPKALELAAPSADLVALVKPQFEVGRAGVGKGGLVRDEAERQRALAEVRAFFESAGWSIRGAADSPVEGGEGAREYLLWAVKR